MVKHLFLFILSVPLLVHAHPGVGIVRDSKGNIFYTDLHRVWKISNGKKTIVVPDAHTHELYIDTNDNLFGEGGYYDDKTVKFYHYLWVLRPNGQLDTVVGMKEEYIHQDFSLAKDKKGNEFYLKRFLAPHTDTNHIYRRSPNNEEAILANGNFKNVNWLHPQDDGSLLYASGNSIFRVDSLGNITTVTKRIHNSNSEEDVLIWGIWQDSFKNVYAAVLSDKTIKKIDPHGNIATIYSSKGKWSPLHGTFDTENKLWVLEGSDKNEVQVVTSKIVLENPVKSNTTNLKMLSYIIGGCMVIGIGILYLKNRKQKSRIASL